MQSSQPASERRLPIWAIVAISIVTIGLGGVVACKLLPSAATQPPWWESLGWLVLAGEAVLYGIAAVLIGARRLPTVVVTIVVGLVARSLMAVLGGALLTSGGMQGSLRVLLVGDMTRTVVEALFVLIGVLLPIKPYLTARPTAAQDAAQPAQPEAAALGVVAPEAPTDLGIGYQGLSSEVAEPTTAAEAPAFEERPPELDLDLDEAPPAKEEQAPSEAALGLTSRSDLEAAPTADFAAPSRPGPIHVEQSFTQVEEAPQEEPAAIEETPAPGPILPGAPGPVAPPVAGWAGIEVERPEAAATEDLPDALAMPETVEGPESVETTEPEPESDVSVEEPPIPSLGAATEPPALEEAEPVVEEPEPEPDETPLLAPEADRLPEPALEAAPESLPEEPGAVPAEERAKLEQLVDQLMASSQAAAGEDSVEVVEEVSPAQPEPPSAATGPLFSFELEDEEPADEEDKEEEEVVPRAPEEAPSPAEPGEPVFRISGDGINAAGGVGVASAFAPAPSEPPPIAEPPPAPEAGRAQPAPVADKVQIPADVASQVVRVSAECVLPQFPDGALSIAPDEVESVFSDKAFEIPLDVIVPQLKGGEVRVSPHLIVPQMPPGSVAASDVELDAALADGIELPLAEIVPQVPASLLNVAASEQTLPEIPNEDIFKVPGLPAFDAVVTASRAPADEPAEPELEAVPVEPEAPPAVEKRDWESLLADVEKPAAASEARPGPESDAESVRVSAEAVLSQIPASAFSGSPEDVVASMDEPFFTFPASDLLGQLADGQIIVPAADVTAQVPPGALRMSPAEIDGALRAGGIQLPLSEVVPQLGEEALAVPGQAPAPEIGAEVLFDEHGAHPPVEPGPEPEPAQPTPAAAEPAATPTAPEPPPAAAEPQATRLAAAEAIRSAVSPIVKPLGLLSIDAVASPVGAMVCVLPEGLDQDAAVRAASALVESAGRLCDRSSHGSLTTLLVTAEGGCAAIGVGAEASGGAFLCQTVARGVGNVGKVGMTMHKTLSALGDIAIESSSAGQPEPQTGEAVRADGDGLDLDAAASAAGSGLSAGVFECRTSGRLAAFGPTSAVASEVAAWADAVLADTRAYAEAVGLGEVSKVILEATGGVAALAAPPKAGLPSVLLMPGRAVKLGLISVQVGKVVAALGTAAP